ncbi:Os11g0412484 [Oryza sativa Japonica Group]|uniref:Os11g0412484 protein n=1 Tax=Oryza sativa subsp. japonica TaxID=39947 RepID=C7J879_ORYSJ|nr:Os11g0412484 [Oryza sativa Japonica Group]|eukprot:NP_001176498.1 Os11g0412484 [Oryza sativa Japonica Group]
MSSRRVNRASVFVILLIVASALSVFTAGGRELVAQETNQKRNILVLHSERERHRQAKYIQGTLWLRQTTTGAMTHLQPSPSLASRLFRTDD